MNGRQTITRALVVLSLAALFGYAYFEARPFLSGPFLEVTEPADGFLTTESPLLVSGTARRITEITLNGNPIFIDEHGEFQRIIPLSPGYNVITVSVRDRFGRTNTREIRGTYEPMAPMPTSVGTTTTNFLSPDTPTPDETATSSTLE